MTSQTLHAMLGKGITYYFYLLHQLLYPSVYKSSFHILKYLGIYGTNRQIFMLMLILLKKEFLTNLSNGSPF